MSALEVYLPTFVVQQAVTAIDHLALPQNSRLFLRGKHSCIFLDALLKLGSNHNKLSCPVSHRRHTMLELIILLFQLYNHIDEA